MLGNNYDFQIASKRLYQDGLKINWPFLVLLPGIFIVKKDKVIYFFLLSLLLMTGVFFLGYLTRVYGVSRLISGIMMFAHFLIAYIVAICFSEKLTIRRISYLCILAIAVFVSLYVNRRLIRENFNITPGNAYNDYGFLRNLVMPNDVILSDRGSNSGIPSFNGKIIASDKPVYWVDDIKERRKAVESFFTRENPDSLRKAILDKYQPDYILLDYTRAGLYPSTIQWIRGLGKIVYKKNQQELIRIKK
jgi:hypothetical protein